MWVTPDGRHLLFIAEKGAGLGGYGHGNCSGQSCRELYVYSLHRTGRTTGT